MDIESTVKYLKDNNLVDGKVESISNKIRDYMELFGLRESEACKLVLKSRKLVSLDTSGDSETSVKAKIAYLENLMGISRGELARVVLSYPSILNYSILDNEGSQVSLPYKVRALRKTFRIKDDEKMKNFLRLNPEALGYSIQKMEEKITEFASIMECSKDDAIRVMRDYAFLQRYDVQNKKSGSGIEAKLARLGEVGITKQDVLGNPFLLTQPANSIKFRYMILSEIYSKNEILRQTSFMISDAKLFARYMFLSSLGSSKAMRSGIWADEKRFFRRYKKSSAYFMKEYPITEKALDDLEKHYNARDENTVKLKLDEVERASILNKKEHVARLER
ncbi:MAG: hypothetical protein IKQ31_03670 [Clostridia bacterium]|nr:hypothetical protein [Clostridia bacterium]